MEQIGNLLPKVSPGTPYTKAEPKCRACLDIGWLYPLVNGRPDFTNVRRCPCRSEQDASDLQQRQMRWCNLPPRTEGKTFETFETYGEKGLVDALRLSKRAADKDNNVIFLTLISESDRGKSHLGVAICRDCLSRGQSASYVNVPRMLNELRDGYDKEGEQAFYVRLKFYSTIGLLVLDDLGTEKVTEWGAEQLQTVINSRYDAKLHTVVTSNRPLDDLFNLHDYPRETWRDFANMRISSRLQREIWCRVIILDTISHKERCSVQ